MECSGFLSQKVPTLAQFALHQFDFPKDADFYTFERKLRIAIHEAFEGKDYYTGLPLPFDQMSIDHVLPRSLKGPDNFYNYVPTTSEINSAKASNFDPSHVHVLKHIQSVYTPRVLALLKHYGAYENRAEDYLAATTAAASRKRYQSRALGQKSVSNELFGDGPTTFRRTMSDPSDTVIDILYFVAQKLSELDEGDLEHTLNLRYLQFEIPLKIVPEIKSEETLIHHIQLSHRKAMAKLDEDALSSEGLLFNIKTYDYDRRGNEVHVQIEFHPMFALKLLEAPRSKQIALEFISSFFNPVDITKEEFIEWSE